MLRDEYSIAVHVLDERIKQILAVMSKMEKTLESHVTKVDDCLRGLKAMELRLDILERDLNGIGSSHKKLKTNVIEHINTDVKAEDWFQLFIGRSAGRFVLWTAFTLGGIILGRWGGRIIEIVF